MNHSENEYLGEWQERIVAATQAKRSGFMATSAEKESLLTRLRVRILWSAMIVLLAGILAKVLSLQVFEAGQKLLLSQNNHIEQIRIVAERGKILDRRGSVLAQDVDDKRVYPEGKIFASVVGYTSQVTEEELGCIKGVCYNPGMRIGRSGVERAMEMELKGKDGGIIEEVDVGGSLVRERGRNEGERGADVELAIDARVQKLMYEAMGENEGVAVLIDVQGKVLGLVTTPTYDPNEITKYLEDTSKPYFLNKATSGVYPPGSVFKMVTAYAGLDSGVIDATTMIEDTGEIKIGEYRYGNWYFDQYGRKEGEVELTKALARSNDIYFYKVGEGVGINRLVTEAKKFGYGAKTGLEIPENAGLVPDPLWKERRTGEKWFLGNTYHLSIGQGDLLVTPVQVARATLGAISGRLCKLSILKNSRAECSDLNLKTDELNLVREGMRKACATGGVAFPFFDFAPYVLCKTGTAQHAGQNPSTGSGPSESEVLPHAWITVAYPGENPEVVLTVFVEAGGEGSKVAAPIAREILEGWKSLN